MENDLIDDSGFELGMPTIEEMLRHECDLLHAELDTSRADLRQAHKNIAKLIVMYRKGVTEMIQLKAEHERISRCLSERYEADRKTKPTLGYAYGAYEKK